MCEKQMCPDDYRQAVLQHDGAVEFRFNQANDLAVTGIDVDATKAQAIYIQIINEMPDNLGAWVNLGILLFETGYTSAACTAFTAAVSYHPKNATAQLYLGKVLLYQNDPVAAEKHFEIALDLNAELAEAHQGLASIFQRRGNEGRAAYHRNKGFERCAQSILNYRGQHTPVKLLILSSSLDGNIPWRLLIARDVFESTIIAVEYFDSPLPDHQLIFNAIGDADLCHDGLKKAARLIEQSTAPVINYPDAVLLTGRLQNARHLGKLPGVIAPHVALIAKSDFYAGLVSRLLADFTFPMLLRSPGFHGGNYFSCVESADELNIAFNALPGEHLLAIEFLDTRTEDGMFRKYRVMSIGGELYPVHLAVSSHWNVHYFSSDMDKNEAYRKEEDAFLNDFAACLKPQAISALKHISQTLALDYCGIDFGLDQDGNILLYEANPTMVVIPPTHEQRWDYKRAAIENVLAAAKKMLLGRLI